MQNANILSSLTVTSKFSHHQRIRREAFMQAIGLYHL